MHLGRKVAFSGGGDEEDVEEGGLEVEGGEFCKGGGGVLSMEEGGEVEGVAGFGGVVDEHGCECGI